MTQQSDTQSSRPNLPEDLPWGINYLREDIQDLRQDARGGISGVRQELKQAVDRLERVIQEAKQEAKQDNAAARQELKETRQELKEDIDKLARRVELRFTWTIATMVGMTGIILAAIKL